MSNLIDDDWSEGDEGAVRKRPRQVARRRTLIPQEPRANPDPALAREPAAAPKTEARPRQASSPEHLRKLQRLTRMRAPYPHRTGRPR
ncbi:MAG: hypothetical protein ACM336_07240 [Acidobacteriota bacterium]